LPSFAVLLRCLKVLPNSKNEENNKMGHKITVDEVKDVILNNRFQITVASAANAGEGRKELLYEPGNAMFSVASGGLIYFTRVVEEAVTLYNNL
jgi:hypothetical protein